MTQTPQKTLQYWEGKGKGKGFGILADPVPLPLPPVPLIPNQSQKRLLQAQQIRFLPLPIGSFTLSVPFLFSMHFK